MGARPWSAATGGVVVSVRLTPKGGRDAVDGVARLSDGRTVLAARVRAAPSDGAANAALVRLMAKAAGVPPGRIAIIGGTTSRIKRLNIAGDASAIIAALEKIATPG